MAAPNMSPWDVPGAPHRPGTNDYEGCALVDNPKAPPKPGMMPTAGQQNTLGFTGVSVGAVVPNCTIGYTGGNPGAINAITSAASAVTLVSAVITATRNGPGDVSLTWPAGTFPFPVTPPKAYVNANIGSNIYSIGAVGITNGVRVTTNINGTPTDVSFTVDVM